ncbi:hypothetical protein E2R60_26440 [Paenibacillus dendritiformis]|uniref:hypothetical protein n=1 Tax=Paenibacillus dendritiformis TaxID=130049 RepID=UPI00105A3AC8|nr:hypothetical protein [Paenibacillus dendritiformis]TDL48441.1 hypothetical protein E2R60_26440 [Paenibacillus dendritiformis]
MRIVKKALFLFLMSVMALGSTVLAKSEKVQVVDPKPVTMLESSTIYRESPPSDKLVRVEKVADLRGIDKLTGEVINEQALKESLLEYYNLDRNNHIEDIQNIDSIVSKIKTSNKNFRNVSPMYSDGQVVKEGWSKEPKLTSSQYYLHYSTSWITEDNYRSDVEITATYTQTLKVSYNMGFTGAVEIKNKFGFSASTGVEQTSTISKGAKVPAWTVWGTRPYIKYRTDNYSGEYVVTIYAGGSLNNYYYTKTGSNNVLLTKSNEYWSRQNTSKNTSATTPSPPTGAPKA